MVRSNVLTRTVAGDRVFSHLGHGVRFAAVAAGLFILLLRCAELDLGRCLQLFLRWLLGQSLLVFFIFLVSIDLLSVSSICHL